MGVSICLITWFLDLSACTVDGVFTQFLPPTLPEHAGWETEGGRTASFFPVFGREVIGLGRGDQTFTINGQLYSHHCGRFPPGRGSETSMRHAP